MEDALDSSVLCVIESLTLARWNADGVQWSGVRLDAGIYEREQGREGRQKQGRPRGRPDMPEGAPEGASGSFNREIEGIKRRSEYH